METSTISKRAVAIKYIVITSMALIVYFTLLAISGFMQYSGMRMVNYLLIALTLYLSFKEIKSKSSPNAITFLGRLGMGFMIVLFTSILFSIFVLVYGMYINPAVINDVWQNPFYHNNTANAMAMAVYIFSETLFLGVVLDLIVAQFFKWGVPPESEEE